MLNFAVFFQELIEQHRVHFVVAHRPWLATIIHNHQVSIHLGDFFGHQSIVLDCLGVVLIGEGDGFEREQRFAGFVHGFDVLLVSRGRDAWGEPAIRIDVNVRTIVRSGIGDAGDIAGPYKQRIANADRTAFGGVPCSGGCADIDVIVTGSEIGPCLITDDRVVRVDAMKAVQG